MASVVMCGLSNPRTILRLLAQGEGRAGSQRSRLLLPTGWREVVHTSGGGRRLLSSAVGEQGRGPYCHPASRNIPIRLTLLSLLH